MDIKPSYNINNQKKTIKTKIKENVCLKEEHYLGQSTIQQVRENQYRDNIHQNN